MSYYRIQPPHLGGFNSTCQSGQVVHWIDEIINSEIYTGETLTTCDVVILCGNISTDLHPDLKLSFSTVGGESPHCNIGGNGIHI